METERPHKWNTADTLTALRLAAAPLLLFPLKTLWFLTIYTLAGVTDALDGWLARKTGKTSDFGAKLDSVADLAFYCVLMIRLYPVLWQRLPREVWYAVGVILLVRLAAYAVAAVKYHRFASLHTCLNKLTGGAVFLLPYVLAASTGVGYGWTVCVLAFAASVEELIIHLSRGEYRADTKSIFWQEN